MRSFKVIRLNSQIVNFGRFTLRKVPLDLISFGKVALATSILEIV